MALAMGDLKSVRLIYLKGALFLLAGGLAAGMLIWEHPSARVAALLAIAIWCFARAYYFAFYVIEHYTDPGFRYRGMWSFVRYVLSRRARSTSSGGAPMSPTTTRPR